MRQNKQLAAFNMQPRQESRESAKLLRFFFLKVQPENLPNANAQQKFRLL